MPEQLSLSVVCSLFWLTGVGCAQLEQQPGSAGVWRAKAMAHAALSEWGSAADNLGTALLLSGAAAPFSLHAELAVSLTRLDRHAEALLQWTR